MIMVEISDNPDSWSQIKFHPLFDLLKFGVSLFKLLFPGHPQIQSCYHWSTSYKAKQELLPGKVVVDPAVRRKTNPLCHRYLSGEICHPL